MRDWTGTSDGLGALSEGDVVEVKVTYVVWPKKMIGENNEAKERLFSSPHLGDNGCCLVASLGECPAQSP